MVKKPEDTQTVNTATATLRNLRTSPNKLNDVARLIRGKTINVALDQLSFCKKRIAKDVRKLVLSAISNAENNHSLDIDTLYIYEASVGKAMVMKRWRARARGRAGKIMKPFSHITVTLKEKAVA